MTLEPLSSTTAVFLLVDHQTGVFERVVKAPPPDQAEANVLRLARAAALLEIPTILTTSEEGRERRAATSARADPPRGARGPHRPPRDHRLAGGPGRRRGDRGDRTTPARHGRDWHGGVRVAPALHARRDGYHVAFSAA
jgi:hypothetical protein